MYLAFGQWNQQSEEDAITSAGHSSFSAASDIPALLMRLKADPYGLGAFSEHVGTQDIDGRKTYRIAETPKRLPGSLYTFWIDAKSGLLVKTQFHVGSSFSSLSSSSDITHIYTYQAVNGPIDDSVFAQ
jgi:hypothetical protein